MNFMKIRIEIYVFIDLRAAQRMFCEYKEIFN